MKKDYSHLIGQRKSKLLITGIYIDQKDDHRVVYVLYKCDCGNTGKRQVNKFAGRSVYTKISCGKCLKRTDVILKKDKVYLRGILHGMMQRCYNDKNISYKHYGGRGISVCDRWQNSLSAFISDMGDRPTDKHSIDRIDNDGNYEPSNCRWGTPKEQRNNQRRVINKIKKTK